MIATVDKNPYGNHPLFNLSTVTTTTTTTTTSGPTAVALEGEIQKNTDPVYPTAPRVVSKIKLRGYSYNADKYSQKKNAGTLSSDGISNDTVLGSDTLAPRHQNKKLVFDDDVDVSNIASLINNRKTEKKKPAFDAKLKYLATTD